MPIPPGFRNNKLRGLGALVPANVPGRLRPWTGVANVPPTDTAAPDVDLGQEAAQAEVFFKQFAGRSLAAPQAQAYDLRPPWIERTAGSEPFNKNGRIATPANDGNDYTVITYTLPFGWDGTIEYLAWCYTGAGFIGGSGDLTWRLLRNGQAIKGYESVVFGLGQISGGASAVQPFVLPSKIRTEAQETISLVVNNAVASGLPTVGTFVIGMIGGYNYPRPGEIR